MKVKITCKQAVDYISKKEEKKLSSWKRVQLWRHLAVCSLCRLFATQNRMITKVLSGFKNEHIQLGEAEKKKIIEKILDDK